MSRIQLAINVDDLDDAITFYSRIFQTAPTKVRLGYANYTIKDPPLKLVLVEKPSEGGSINHLGVEVETPEEVREAETRLSGIGMETTGIEITKCCYAEKTETWVQGPDGIRWEWYVKHDDTEQFDNIQIGKEGNTLIITVEERPSISAIELSGNKALKTEQLLESLDGVGIKEGEVYKIRLPINISQDFDALLALEKEPNIDQIIFVEHKVKTGESVWLIARKYNVRIADIIMVNKKLKNKKHIHPGQKLVIPVGSDKLNNQEKKKNNYIFHKIKRNETLSHIAMKYRTSVRKIKKWNGLRSNKIKYGSKLKIYTN